MAKKKIQLPNVRSNNTVINNPIINSASISLAQCGAASTITAYKNRTVFLNNLNLGILDALERYKLTGYPDTVDERVCLESLLWYGCICFYVYRGNIFALPVAPDADVTMYGKSGGGFLISANGKFNKQVKFYIEGSDTAPILDDTIGVESGNIRGVLIKENREMYPFINYIIQYAEAMTDTYRTIDVIRKNLKTPYVFGAKGEETVNSIRRFIEKRNNNEEEIVIDTGIFDPDSVTAIQLYTDGNSLNDARQLLEWYDNRRRELCGISSNAQMDKKGENLISDEVHVNDAYEDMAVRKCVDYMNEQMEYCNKMLGTSMKWEVKEHGQKSDVRGNSGERGNDISGGNSGDATGSDI